jgi:hypothetical protein
MAFHQSVGYDEEKTITSQVSQKIFYRSGTDTTKTLRA